MDPGLVVGFFLSLAALHPLNGITFLLLVIPFFLGNPTKPYIFLLEIFIYGTLCPPFSIGGPGKIRESAP